MTTKKFEALHSRTTQRLTPTQFLAALAVVTLFALARMRWPQLDG